MELINGISITGSIMIVDIKDLINQTNLLRHTDTCSGQVMIAPYDMDNCEAEVENICSECGVYLCSMHGVDHECDKNVKALYQKVKGYR